MDAHKTIGEVSAELGLTLRALRFYEDKGLIHPRRVGTRRLYDAAQVERIGLIVKWVRAGVPLKDVRQCLAYQDEANNDALAVYLGIKLSRLRKRLLKQVEAIDQLRSEAA